MTTEREWVRHHLTESARIKQLVADQCLDSIIEASRLIATAFREGNKLLLCGNGGSAADCQHVAAEFTSRLSKDLNRRALPAIALTTDTAFLTAYSNDFGYEGVFERQIEALGAERDVLIGISTSGNSPNVLRAMHLACARGMKTIALSGTTGKIRDLATVCISVPSENTQFIQESHLVIEHIICELVEQALFGEGR